MQRKRVKLGLSNFGDLVNHSEKMHGDYTDRLEEVRLLSGKSSENAEVDGNSRDWNDGEVPLAREAIFLKGKSKRYG